MRVKGWNKPLDVNTNHQIQEKFEFKWYPLYDILAVPQLATAKSMYMYVSLYYNVNVVWKFIYIVYVYINSPYTQHICKK